jgi:hypothetical protein
MNVVERVAWTIRYRSRFEALTSSRLNGKDIDAAWEARSPHKTPEQHAEHAAVLWGGAA